MSKLTRTFLLPPPALTTSALSATSVRAAWTAVRGATGYRLYRNGAQVYAGSALTVDDTGLTTGAAYAYTVAAVGGRGVGPASSASSVALTGGATTQRLLGAGDVTYLGYVNGLWTDGIDNTVNHSYEYQGVGAALSVSEDGRFLYCAGHDYGQRISRLALPAAALPTALGGTGNTSVGGTVTVSTPLTSVPGDSGAAGTKNCGSLEWAGRLIVSKYTFYDGGGTASRSHTVAANAAALTGWGSMQRVGTRHPNFYGGPMGVIPPEWRTLLGGPAITSQSTLSIITTTSAGPCAFVFDPADVGVVTGTVTATPLMWFDPTGARSYMGGALDTTGVASEYWSLADAYGGFAFPAGTRSFLCIHRHGFGPLRYKNADNSCGESGGYSAPPYRLQVSAFDANDLLAVKTGTKQPWELQPYAIWTLPVTIDGACVRLARGGVAYDPVTRRIYAVAQWASPSQPPRIHVWQVT